jgi:hypothetical protein
VLARCLPSSGRFERVFATGASIGCRGRWQRGARDVGVCHFFDVVDSPAREQLVDGEATCHGTIRSAVGIVFHRPSFFELNGDDKAKGGVVHVEDWMRVYSGSCLSWSSSVGTALCSSVGDRMRRTHRDDLKEERVGSEGKTPPVERRRRASTANGDPRGAGSKHGV